MRTPYWTIALCGMSFLVGCSAQTANKTKHYNLENSADKQAASKKYVRTHDCKPYGNSKMFSYLDDDGEVLEGVSYTTFSCINPDLPVTVDYEDGKPWRP